MWKPTRSRAEQQFAAGQKKDQTLIKQKEKTQRERDDRMARLRDLRLAKEAAERASAELPEDVQAVAAPASLAGPESADKDETTAPRLPRVHPHRS